MAMHTAHESGDHARKTMRRKRRVGKREICAAACQLQLGLGLLRKKKEEESLQFSSCFLLCSCGFFCSFGPLGDGKGSKERSGSFP